VGFDADLRAARELQRLLELVGLLPVEIPVLDDDRSFVEPSGNVAITEIVRPIRCM